MRADCMNLTAMPSGTVGGTLGGTYPDGATWSVGATYSVVARGGRFACAAVALVLMLAVVGCGDDKPAQSPVDAKGNNAVAPPVSNNGAVPPVGAPAETSNLSGNALTDYNDGWKAWQAGDLQAAKKSFQAAAKGDPKSPAPEYALGVVLEHLGEASGAQQAYRAAFNIKSDYEPALGGYALSLAGKGSVSEADSFLTEKHARFPNSARITTFLAEVKSLAGDHGTAQQLAQDALRMNPDLKEAMVLVARDHYRARKLELARYALRAVLIGFGDASPARDPESAEGHLLQGLIDRDYGRRADALSHFESSVRKRPDLVEALIQLGSMKLEAGNAAEAQAPLENAVRYAPTSAVAHLNLGDCYRLLGRVAEAKRSFDQALALDAALGVVHYDLGLLHLFAPNMPSLSATEQVATAISEFEKYKTMRGLKGNDDVDDLLSRAKAKQNELKLASGAPPAAAPAAPVPAAPAPAKAPGAAAPTPPKGP